MKKKKRDLIILIFILLLIILSCFTLWYMRSYYCVEFVKMTRVDVNEGVYDLSNVDFTNGFACLQGDVEYIPGVLSPEEYRAKRDNAIVGYPSDVPSATSYKKIKMPDNDVYMLTSSSTNYAHSLYIGDELRYQAGVPADNADDFVPGYAQIKLEARASDGYIEVYQQGANFVHRENGGHNSIYIGTPEIINRYIALSSGLEMFTVGLFFALFFVHAILYIVWRSYPANLTFALLCFTWMIRVGVTGNKVFYELFPDLSWYLAIRAEYISLPIASIMIVLLICQVFDGIAQKWFVRTVNIVSSGFIILCLLANTVFMSWALIPYEGFFIVAIIYLVIRFVMKVPKMIKNNQFKTEQTVALIAYSIFMCATINDVLYHLNAGFPFMFSLTYVAMLIFSFFLMTAMFYGTMREITLAHEREQKAQIQSAMLEEMNQLKSNFYTEISHEMKTPLTVISINAQFAAQNIKTGIVDGETITDLNAISAEAKRLAQMVTSLVDLGRLQGSKESITVLAIDNLLIETARIYQSLFARRNNILTVADDLKLPMVEGNADQLVQVLINLLSNANRHCQNGIVTINGEVVNNKVMVSVADNGDGIPSELLPHVFEQYCRGKEGGAGLGLAICKSIIEEHGGEIGIESEVGKGTKVWFTLVIKGEESNG